MKRECDSEMTKKRKLCDKTHRQHNLTPQQGAGYSGSCFLTSHHAANGKINEGCQERRCGYGDNPSRKNF